MIFVQNRASTERNVLRKHCLLTDEVCIIDSENLTESSDYFKSADLCWGSVEWVKFYLELHNAQIPPIETYPSIFSPNDYRRSLQLERDNKERWLSGTWFIKPSTVKEYNGFVIVDGKVDAEKEEDLSQWLRSDSSFWVSSVVNWNAEWRVYLLEGVIKGIGRYDENECEYDYHLSWIEDRVSRMGKVTGALDMGLLEEGEMAIVEWNAGWSLGYYKDKDSIDEKDFVTLLKTGWNEIRCYNDWNKTIRPKI